jgi:menaquinol-cytochrome c reductase iron-sulfur subunit
MQPSSDHCVSRGRRRALILFVNTTVALIGGGLSALLGAFALRPPSASTSRERWIKAGTTANLRPEVPVPRVLTITRTDGWYRERSRRTVFLTWDGDGKVRAMSAQCTHLGCQVRWAADEQKFRCPCHGGVFDAQGNVLDGPPPRPLDTMDARIDPDDGAVLVRV